MRKRLVLALGALATFALVAIALGLSSASSAGSAVSPGATANQNAAGVTEGKKLFGNTCAGCHGVDASGGMGPSLKSNTFVRSNSESDLVAFVTKGRPGTAMPPKGGNSSLTTEDLEAIVAYLKSLNGGTTGGATTATTATTHPATTTATGATTKGDVEIGKDLFRGSSRLANGGPPCMSCHSVAGVGALGGGELGPSLDGAAQKYGGETGLAAWLAAPASQTMKPIFTSKPMTDQERADIATFLSAGSLATRSTAGTLKLFAIALAGAIILFALTGFIWTGRRLRGVRTPLVTAAKKAERLPVN